jgi:hypothetical protein
MFYINNMPLKKLERYYRMATSKLFVDPENIKRAAADDWAKCVSASFESVSVIDAPYSVDSAFARIENHYFINGVGYSRIVTSTICQSGL